MKDYNNLRVSKNFKLNEFESKISHEVILYHPLIKKLQKIRDIRKKPLIITSGFRTRDDHIRIYQKKHGNKWEQYIPWGSGHLTGKAVDISLKGHEDLTLFELAIKSGFKGVILNPERGYLHVDLLNRIYRAVI